MTKFSHQELLFVEIKALDIRYVLIKVYLVDIWRDQNSFRTFTSKMFKFLNQCFDVGISVSNSQNLLAGSTAVLLETLF